MWIENIIERLDVLTGGNGWLCGVAILDGFLLPGVAVIACFCKSEALYAALSAVLMAGIEMVAFVSDSTWQAAAFIRAIAWLVVGVVGLLVVGIVALLRRFARRKARLILNENKGGGRLPERDNSYVRARLYTALRGEEKDGISITRKSVPYENRGMVRLGYARRLLAGVQDAPLSPAERLEVEILARSFAEYALCERWDCEQLRSVNELFARLLKLSAKYGVEEGQG